MNHPAALLIPARQSHVDMRQREINEPRPPLPATPSIDAEMDFRLRDIMDKRALSALFQPIVDLAQGKIVAYEGLIRGPSNSPLHSPVQLFRAAAMCNRSVEVEHLCRRITLETFARMGLAGDLFLNVSPDCLLSPDARYGETLCAAREIGIDPQRVVIELTEHQPAYDYELLREAVRHYRALGFRIAIDDLGEGFSSLRLWSELRPEFVKIDMHFIQGCNIDPVKKQFLRSIQEIARNSGSQVIAEGVETAAELSCVQDIGIARGQGYFFARPSSSPPAVIVGEAAAAFIRRPSVAARSRRLAPSAAILLNCVTPIASSATIEDAYATFDRDPDLPSLPVVDNGMPRGIIGRHSLIDRLAKPFRRELFGRKPCHLFMNQRPLLIEISTSLQELGRIIAEGEQQHLTDGFIIVENGLYRGVGTGQDLMREITRMQIQAAHHANALTGLPGNEPINDAIHGHLERNQPFWAAYCDLDHFKPFNDVYGFARGDDVIRMLAQTLTEHTDAALDFVGHIGGDDFLVLFGSPDWELRCRNILEGFGATANALFSPGELADGGYMSEDRHGKRVFTPLVSLSIGVVHVDPQHVSTHHQVSSAAAVAKKEAKKIVGNSLFVERRESQ
jgi:EAL domain-containing protein (putative c-di-GMP-specific phosphodiesterase class I)/GGDEF domain-containing protein